MVLRIHNQSLEINLLKGAAISNLSLSSNGKSRSVISPQANYHFESSFLFPFPNRLAGGVFSFEGKEFKFPLNDSGRPNALHGLIHDKAFVLVSQEDNRLVLSHVYDGKLSFYPFPFEMTVSYELSPGTLDIGVVIQNTGTTSMPCAFGWHPYFNMTESLDDSTLRLSNVEFIEVDDNLIPTGKSTPYKTLEQSTSLSGIVLDNCFRYLDNEKKNSVKLQFSDKSGFEIWQDQNLPFVQLFTPTDGKTVAIEPMTSNINALNTGDGLNILEPQQSLDLSFGVSLR